MPGGLEPPHCAKAGTSLKLRGVADFGRAWVANAVDAVNSATKQPNTRATRTFFIYILPLIRFPYNARAATVDNYQQIPAWPSVFIEQMGSFVRADFGRIFGPRPGRQM
jgi:hypothetical protein